MIVYKVGNFFYNYGFPLIPSLCNFFIRLIHNSAVHSQTSIGKGTVFGYGGIAIVIHKRAVIGRNCVIGSCVTIGGKSKSHAVPVIGDNVYIATGAKILGDVKVGNNCVIGANAVVVTSIPDNCLVVGVPAKIIRENINPRDYY